MCIYLYKNLNVYHSSDEKDAKRRTLFFVYLLYVKHPDINKKLLILK